MPEETKNYVELTGDIVSAYVTANNMQRSELPGLIADVHMALTNLVKPTSESVKVEPLVPIKQTIKPDYIISLEDGRRYKSMKRHLSSRGITPEQYREKWGLRPNYPMVAPNYSKARSELAQSLGLGQVRKGQAQKTGKKASKKKAAA